MNSTDTHAKYRKYKRKYLAQQAGMYSMSRSLRSRFTPGVPAVPMAQSVPIRPYTLHSVKGLTEVGELDSKTSGQSKYINKLKQRGEIKLITLNRMTKTNTAIYRGVDGSYWVEPYYGVVSNVPSRIIKVLWVRHAESCANIAKPLDDNNMPNPNFMEDKVFREPLCTKRGIRQSYHIGRALGQIRTQYFNGFGCQAFCSFLPRTMETAWWIFKGMQFYVPIQRICYIMEETKLYDHMMEIYQYTINTVNTVTKYISKVPRMWHSKYMSTTPAPPENTDISFINRLKPLLIQKVQLEFRDTPEWVIQSVVDKFVNYITSLSTPTSFPDLITSTQSTTTIRKSNTHADYLNRQRQHGLLDPEIVTADAPCYSGISLDQRIYASNSYVGKQRGLLYDYDLFLETYIRHPTTMNPENINVVVSHGGYIRLNVLQSDPIHPNNTQSYYVEYHVPLSPLNPSEPIKPIMADIQYSIEGGIGDDLHDIDIEAYPQKRGYDYEPNPGRCSYTYEGDIQLNPY